MMPEISRKSQVVMSTNNDKKRRRKSAPRTVSTVQDLLREGIPKLLQGNSANFESTPHLEDIGQDAATILERRIDFDDELPFTVSGTESSPSRLLLLRGSQYGFIDQKNETQIRNLVFDCLIDALTLLDLHNGKFQVDSEVSTFSTDPDILVVRHGRSGIIILVVQVKKPGADVFTAREVGGQVYNHLLGNLLVAAGRASQPHPFAVLTTYDAMVVAHLDDEQSKEILQSNAQDLESDFPQVVLEALEITDESSGSGKKVFVGSDNSPESALNRVFDCMGNAMGPLSCDKEESKVDTDYDEDSNDEFSRTVVYTQPFRGKEIMKALILAIRCGLESVACSQPRRIPMEGAKADGSCALVNKEGIVWTKMPGAVNFTYDHFPGSTSTPKLYLWHDLGRGAKGHVFLACDSNGKACALKFFVVDDALLHRQASPKIVRQQWRETQMKRKKKEAEAEKDYWIQVYGEKFHDQVRVVQLNKLWCLMMPYFDRLAKERREQSLPAVKAFLEHCKSVGLRYRDEDLRWHHIGTRGNDIFVLDLGSLDECENEHDFEIDKQMNTLSGSMS